MTKGEIVAVSIGCVAAVIILFFGSISCYFGVCRVQSSTKDRYTKKLRGYRDSNLYTDRGTGYYSVAPMMQKAASSGSGPTAAGLAASAYAGNSFL